MGKRSKSGNKEVEDIEIKDKKDKKKSKKETKHELLETNEDTEKNTVPVSEDNETAIISNNENICIIKKKRKHNKSLTHDNTPNKKTIFDDNGEALEVTINKKKTKNKKATPVREEQPTEEEIDQFCDEITEEDNVEFENWVKLIEEKITSNKKKLNNFFFFKT